MFALRYRHNITKCLYSDMRKMFCKELRLLVAQTLTTRMAKLAGWKPIEHAACVNSCMAFTGSYEHLDRCYYCNTPRGDHSYFTLPLAPQLKSLYGGDGKARSAMDHTREMLESHNPGEYRDIHDGDAVRSLLGKKVVVDGEEQKHSYFQDTRDIPLGMMTDGFQCFKRVHRGKASAWPVILLNYGRSSLNRMQISNIIPFSIIPGPNQPKDFNSFLFPLKVELDEMARGVDAYDGREKKIFELHAYLVMATGDMPAVKHISYMKGPNSKCPCRLCSIKGVYHTARKTYYTPLRPPDDARSVPARPSYDPQELPLRTTSDLKQQICEIQSANTATARDELAKEYGISGKSILLGLPGFDPMLAYPHECMHLLFENIIPMLIYAWKGNFRDVDTTEELYVISAAQWENVGRLTVESNLSIPSALSRSIPNIWIDQNLFTAEAYAFWFIHMAPSLLHDRFRDEKYYKHMLLLVEIIKTLLKYEITAETLDGLEEDIYLWVTQFEWYES
jgi:tnp2 family transposase